MFGLLFEAFLVSPDVSFSLVQQMYSSLKNLILPLKSMNAYFELALQNGVDRSQLEEILNEILAEYPPTSYHKHHLKTLLLWIESCSNLHELIDTLEMSFKWGRLGFKSVQCLYVKKLKEFQGDELDFKLALARWAIPIHPDTFKLLEENKKRKVSRRIGDKLNHSVEWF